MQSLASAPEPVDKSAIQNFSADSCRIMSYPPVSAEHGINEPTMIDNFRPEIATR
jgi:hypothetical protein